MWTPAGDEDLSTWWPAAVADRTGLRTALEAAYADPGRGYHDTLHLLEVLARIDEIAASGVGFDRDAVLLAAWFHDSVYDGGPDAEGRSAAWAERALADLPALAAEVSRLVRMTESHRPAAGDVAAEVLSDADLGILGAPPGRYGDYTAAVRAEYAAVPDELFRSGRARILRELLAKPTLFHTAHARGAWEAAARANVEREIAALTGKAGRAATR
ncbi:MAG: hypothetical protein JWL64_2068 [Frankiales bacterium]|nr:hypothetical protein [Frankiales bacterium]